ncbi:hypothetical protein JIN84_04655 [Luteolibacter yonseiensis]|uniref:Uncharacterized protein n=1 Tax=Luteolibacter yonseiensis TaxID=1144680 RepID=A0A934QY88_9BACT|nr:hypothetical protein [Luteolibacter yonseiensis]MBK1814893.1 hypothetical protein [Luteolibacter yonseiensis]
MAWRIEEAVAHGEIDNTVEGRTTGRIWLAGRDEPLILSLDGDCWRDLAGTRLQFENPSPVTGPDAEALDIDQTGIVGDMTASRKNKIPTVSEEEFNTLYQNHQEIPYEWHNTLYLEWFSEINGRVVIESAGYTLTISPHEWQMDEDGEDAQKLANLNSMRDFMAQVIRRRDPEGPEPDVSGELDEFAWEERLKESDRLTDAYQEVLEKYMEDVDSEQKEAFVMGWDGLLDALADRDEAGENEFSSESADFGPDDDARDFEDGGTVDDDFDDDEGSFGNEEDHPLQRQAQELAMRAMDVVRSDGGPGTPSYQLVTNLLQVSGKLAGVLHGRGSGYEPEAGFVLAVLKRCLNWLNEAVGSCQELMEIERDPDQRAALEHLRSSAFEIRDSIVELRRELK